MKNRFLEPTQETGAVLLRQNISGEVVTLNMLHLREIADYIESPELAPATGISGRKALQRYIDHTLPFLNERARAFYDRCTSGPSEFILYSWEQDASR